MTADSDPARILEQIDAFPFAPGTSPFRIKGNGYRGKVRYLETVPGGTARVFEVLDRPAIEAFYGQTFLASVWYDLMPLIATSAAAAIIRGESFEACTRDRSRHQVREDMSGVHRMIMRLAPAKIIAKRVPNLIAQYFDFVDVEAEPSGPTAVRFDLRRIPEPIDRWLGAVVATYLEEVVRAGGVVDIDVRLDRADDGKVAGVRAHRLHFDVNWKLKRLRA